MTLPLLYGNSSHKDYISCIPLTVMTSSNGNIFRVTGLWWGESTGGLPSQRPVTRSFDVFFDLHLKKRLNKQSRHRWFETPLHSFWRHRNVQFMTRNPTCLFFFVRKSSAIDMCMNRNDSSSCSHVITTHLLFNELRDMFNLKHVKTWQRKFPVGFPIRICALDLLYINTFVIK